MLESHFEPEALSRSLGHVYICLRQLGRNTYGGRLIFSRYLPSSYNHEARCLSTP